MYRMFYKFATWTFVTFLGDLKIKKKAKGAYFLVTTRINSMDFLSLLVYLERIWFYNTAKMKRKLNENVVDEKRIEALKVYALKNFDVELKGLPQFCADNEDENCQDLIVFNGSKCLVCGVNDFEDYCNSCGMRICKNKLCVQDDGEADCKCCICVQFDELFCSCTGCNNTVICREGIDSDMLIRKLGAVSSRGQEHPLIIEAHTCHKCHCRVCDQCYTYKEACVECSETLPDVWYKAMGITLLDASTQLADPEIVPDPVADEGDVTASGAAITILKDEYGTVKGPYAKCCECGKRWLYDSGLPDKGKPCDCECEADEDDQTYCCGYGFDRDMIMCNDENAFSDEERHLVIQTTATCSRNDFLLGVDFPPCNATFVVDGDIAIDAYTDWKGGNEKKYVCSTCAEQFMSLFCPKCTKLFENSAKLSKHIVEEHSE